MQKSKLLASLLAVSLVTVGCSSEEKSTSKSETKQETKQTTKKEEKKTLSINDEWIVEGQWKLKINSVTTTDYRNQFSQDKPAEVVIIDYTYENIGYKKDIQDLYLSPTSVIDGAKKVAKNYPAEIKTYPQPTPEGAIMENAQAAFGLNTESAEITINFMEFDNNNKPQEVNFKVPVQK